jgi:ABC-type branched-subunit amino acid transport system substrate-binding protein
MTRMRSCIVMALVAGVALAACGSGTSTKTTTTTTPAATTTTAGPVTLTDSFRGVTSTSIKLGVAIIDYDCIKQFIDFTRGDQQAIEQSFVDDVNNHGGVLGRKIDPVYKKYCPISPQVALDTCTSFTQDAKVFAVVGVFAPTSPDAQLCLSRDHQTILIGHELHQATIDEAPPGLLITPDITAERLVNVLVNLLKKQGTLTGKKVAILADQDTKGPADTVVKPAFVSLGLQQGSEAVLTITGTTDTSASQAQLDSFIEKWKGEGVQALFLTGLNVSAKQFVEKIKAAMPGVLLMTDGESGAHDAAQGEVTAHKTPNPYEGILTAAGLSGPETFQLPATQHCVQIYQAAGGPTVIGPADVKPGPDGKTAQIYQAVEDFCQELNMFKQIAEKAGPNLTNTTWTTAVDTFGKINLGGSGFASLTKGKYDADDGFRLVTFDSTIPPQGDWKPLTALLDASS